MVFLECKKIMAFQKIKKLLIANRGEIACKIIRSAKELNIPTLAIYSDADSTSSHTELADEAIHIPGVSVSETYMNSSAIIEIAKINQVNAIHPGYGLLSENADFVELVEKNKLIFIGPNSNIIRQMGEKDKAKSLMEKDKETQDEKKYQEELQKVFQKKLKELKKLDPFVYKNF